MNYKYQGLYHYPLIKPKELPRFYIETFHRQWKYLAKHPREINYETIKHLFFRRIINMQEFYKIIFSKNYNLACQYATTIQVKYQSFCNYCPYISYNPNIEGQCKIYEFNRYNELIQQYLFNLNKYIHCSQLQPGNVLKSYKYELKRIHNQIKEIINQILNLKIKPYVLLKGKYLIDPSKKCLTL